MGRILFSKNSRPAWEGVCPCTSGAHKIRPPMTKPKKKDDFFMRQGPSGNHTLDHTDAGNAAAGDICQMEITAVVAIVQVIVVETEQMKNGRVQIMDMDRVFHRRRAKFVGGAIDGAA